jgi:tetratricopeptide (TPR) repeat protein
LTGPEDTEQRLGIDLLRGNLEAVRGNFAKATEIMKPVLDEARATGNLRIQANALGRLGRVCMWQGDAPTAAKYIGEALELSRSLGDRAALIFNLRQMGNILVMTDPREALTYHEESVDLARQAGDRGAEAHGLNSLAIAFQLGGDPEKSMATFMQSLELNRVLGDRLNEAMVLGNVAGLYSASGELETAERKAKEALAIAKEIGAISLLPSGEIMLAEIHLRGGRNAEARKWLRTTTETMRTIGVSPTMVAVLYGILKVREGDRAKGLAWIGFGRAHDPNTQEVVVLIRSFGELLRGDASEEEMEAAMRAGEGLKVEDILAEAERETT